MRKTLGLSALAGLASEGASQVVKKISGKGVQRGGFLIPQNKINKLIANKHLLSTKQKKDILEALQSGSHVIKPTKTQSGGFLGTLLASIGIPMERKGAPRMGLYRPPPVIGTWDNKVGMGKKKKEGKRSTIRTKQPVQFNPTYRGITVKPKFYEDIPMSNHDLIKWCRYLNIPINDVLSRDQKVPHNHKQALFIYNLEPSYMNGSHWVTTYVKDNIINYFDSFGMPPFQELVNHAKRKNLTLLHQNNQIQNIKTTTCGYFCLYFLNEMNKGNSYFDLLKVFNIHDTIKNERFIKHYFKNIYLYMTNCKPYGLNLSKEIQDAIIEAHNDKTEITIGLNYNELKGNDKLMLTNKQIDKITNAIKDGKRDKNKRGVTIIKISKTQIKKAPKNILPEEIILPPTKPYCGMKNKIPPGSYRGSIQECLQKNQIRYYRTQKVDQKLLQELIDSMPKRKRVSPMDYAKKKRNIRRHHIQTQQNQRRNEA